MPVTVRLSQKLCERLGDDVADEIVDWFNAVDESYRNQLRESNDLNWERFKAELRATVALSESRLNERIVNLRAELIAVIAESEARLNEKIVNLRAELSAAIAQSEARLNQKFSDLRADMMKWMFIYWSGTVLSLGGLMIALLRK